MSEIGGVMSQQAKRKAFLMPAPSGQTEEGQRRVNRRGMEKGRPLFSPETNGAALPSEF